MNEKLNRFIENIGGNFVEISYKPAIYQCMDLVYAWIFTLDIPKSTIQNQYAYQVWENPKEITKEYFYLIENTPEAIPQAGDIVVWGHQIGTAGHIAIATGKADLNSLEVFEQNNPLGSAPKVNTRSYYGVLGWLRPKVKENNEKPEITDQTKIRMGGRFGTMEVQAIRSTINDQASTIEKLSESLEASEKEQKTAIEQAVSTATAECEEKWQSELENAKENCDLERTELLKKYEVLQLRKVERFSSTELFKIAIKKLLRGWKE